MGARSAAELENDRGLIGSRFRIEHTLAQGGMGTVYSVLDERSGERVALKRMRRPLSSDMLVLFEREYRTLAAIAHPRIIRVYDYGVDAGEPYYTMELVQGRDVQELAPIPVADACRYLRDVATCLALLHTRRLVHRDIAPRNVRVTPEGHCKLLDFGALMSFGVPDRLIGTPPCMAPELLQGAPLDQRADLYALGALAYFMLTGRHAHPARDLQQLPESWEKRPAPPSKHAAEIPPQLDTLILGLLQLEPSARPSSIAEVVERLTVLGALAPEDDAAQQALAASYFAHVQFVGRHTEQSALREHIAGLREGRGKSVLIEADHGVGRTRLLAELLVQARLSGTPSVSIDASMHRQPHGTAIALCDQLLVLSQPAMQTAAGHAALLSQLDPGLAARLGTAPAVPESMLSGDWRARVQELLHEIVAAACRSTPLLLAVDNIEEADEASLALLAGLQQITSEAPLALVCSARTRGDEADAESMAESLSRRVLREGSQHLELVPLGPREVFELARSVFGDAPDLAKLGEWLHDRSAGRPLHCMELLRRLHASGVVRYADGLWVLPLERPDAALAGALDELLAQRLAALSTPAYRLSEALAVQHSTLTRERVLTFARGESADAFALIEELLRADVLIESVHGYRFGHGVLRDALLSAMPPARRSELHLLCAEQRLRDAHETETTLARIEAGWHLMHAGDEGRGADLLADVAYDTVGARFAFVDLQVAAPALEAALKVYRAQGRSPYELMPLLSALGQAGYYEARVWGEKYGDEALAAVLDVSGVALAQKLQRFVGKTPGLLIGVLYAFVRFIRTPRRLRRYPFRDIFVQLFGLATTLTGMRASALDGKGAERPALALLPFAHLPERLTPVGIFHFCQALKEITRENEAYAIRIWSRLLEQFENSRFYLALPPKGRPPYIGGLWFARGVFESFRDGRGALHAADQMDRTNLKLYRMVACQVRVLYYGNRGELEQARRHTRQVELHALQIGSAAQIELWEGAAQILVHGTIGDLVEMKRVSDRLTSLARKHASLAPYAELAQIALDHIRYIPAGPADFASLQSAARSSAEATIARMQAYSQAIPPRGAIGWGYLHGLLMSALNALGRFEEAERVGTQTLSHLSAEDRPFVVLFLAVEIELAVAEAGLAKLAAARARLDELLTFHAASDNPLTRGRLHDGYARVAALAADWQAFRHHIEETRSWYRCTSSPALLARVEALSGLQPWRSSVPPPPASAGVHSIRSVRSVGRPTQNSVVQDETLDTPTIVQPTSTPPTKRDDTLSLPIQKRK